MKPFLHGKLSVKKYGGKLEDYQALHDFLDSPKMCHPDLRHRAILHSSFGCYLVERIFGTVAVNSDGKQYSPRDVAEDHILQDVGTIPTVSDYLNHLPMLDWLGGPKRETRKMKLTADGIEIVD